MRPHHLTVFGNDDRREIDLPGVPWKAVGRIELLPPGEKPAHYSGNIAFCTGSLVSPDLVLTNAHCVLDAGAARLSAQTIWFHAGLSVSGGAHPAARVVKVWLGSLNPNSHRSDDWALLRLEKPIGHEVGWLRMKPFPGDDWQVNPDVATTLVAYAMDYKSGRSPSIQDRCSITQFDEHGPYLRHNCDMNAGSSGGPLLWLENDIPYIVAVNAAHMSKEKVSYREQFSAEEANVAIGSDHFFKLVHRLSEEEGARPLVSDEAIHVIEVAAQTDGGQNSPRSEPTALVN